MLRVARLILPALLAAAAALVPLPAAAQSGDVTVFAASSLTTALDEIVGRWKRESGKTAVVSYAASSVLAKQVEQGAPADVFISADDDWMNYLAERKLIRPETRRDLLGNSLVLVAERRSSIPPLVLSRDADLPTLLHGGRLAMADVDAVPAGKYGKAALQSLGLWDSLKARIAEAENVRAALLLVSRGEAPLGIVYATDAAADPTVRVVATFPESSHPNIRYPVALTANARADADAFIAFLFSDSVRPPFERQGFRIVK